MMSLFRKRAPETEEQIKARVRGSPPVTAELMQRG